jgi:hypothetical protein
MVELKFDDRSASSTNESAYAVSIQRMLRQMLGAYSRLNEAIGSILVALRAGK